MLSPYCLSFEAITTLYHHGILDAGSALLLVDAHVSISGMSLTA